MSYTQNLCGIVKILVKYKMEAIRIKVLTKIAKRCYYVLKCMNPYSRLNSVCYVVLNYQIYRSNCIATVSGCFNKTQIRLISDKNLAFVPDYRTI